MLIFHPSLCPTGRTRNAQETTVATNDATEFAIADTSHVVIRQTTSRRRTVARIVARLRSRALRALTTKASLSGDTQNGRKSNSDKDVADQRNLPHFW